MNETGEGDATGSAYTQGTTTGTALIICNTFENLPVDEHLKIRAEQGLNNLKASLVGKGLNVELKNEGKSLDLTIHIAEDTHRRLTVVKEILSAQYDLHIQKITVPVHYDDTKLQMTVCALIGSSERLVAENRIQKVKDNIHNSLVNIKYSRSAITLDTAMTKEIVYILRSDQRVSKLGENCGLTVTKKYDQIPILMSISLINESDSRVEAKEDVIKLKDVLGRLGFLVKDKYDLTAIQMIAALKDEAKADHSKASCFLCIISSHGMWAYTVKEGTEDQEVVIDYIEDTNGVQVPIESLTKRILGKEAPNLMNKPKIFLLQNCRGFCFAKNLNLVEELGCVIEADWEQYAGAEITNPYDDRKLPEDIPIPYLIPAKKDYFLHFSTSPGFLSWKSKIVGEVGTPFLRAWCRVLSESNENNNSLEIHDMATRVNAIVCEEFTSYSPSRADEGYDNRRQAPQFISALMKDFIFPQISN